MQKTLLFFFLILLTFILTSCKNDEPQIDPQKAIIGKWEITHLGNKRVDSPIAYEEYLADSILVIYNYEEDRFSYKKYWLTDSLLIKSISFIDDVTNEPKELTFPYKFEFITPNELKLDLQEPFIITLSIYKRIN